MRLMREALSKAVQHRLGPPAIGKPGLQAQLEWIAGLPASLEAERLLALAEVEATDRDPMLPALLTLLQWALEEVPGLDKSRALATWEKLMQLDLRGEPKAAVLALLPCEDPEHEIPIELLGNSAGEAAEGIVSLAASAWRRLSWPARRQFATVRT